MSHLGDERKCNGISRWQSDVAGRQKNFNILVGEVTWGLKTVARLCSRVREERKESKCEQAPGGCVWMKLNVLGNVLAEWVSWVWWDTSGVMWYPECAWHLSSLGKPLYECSKRMALRWFMMVWKKIMHRKKWSVECQAKVHAVTSAEDKEGLPLWAHFAHCTRDVSADLNGWKEVEERWERRCRLHCRCSRRWRPKSCGSGGGGECCGWRNDQSAIWTWQNRTDLSLDNHRAYFSTGGCRVWIGWVDARWRH